MKSIIKKTLCLLISFMMVFSSFAAVVSDNDGSAFITKSEFDSLKNDFQSQLDAYNTNIDNKIDNAIAAYLSGVKMDTTFVIESNILNFDYPITIIDKRKIIEEVKTSATTSVGNDTLWAPGYYFVASAKRDGKEPMQEFKWDSVDNIKTYLNGTANTSTGTFKVTNLLLNPKLSFTTAFQHENLNANAQAYTTVFLDQSSLWTSGASFGMPVTRNNIRANYNLNVKASTYSPVFQGCHHPNALLTWNGSGQSTYDNIKGSSGTQQMWDSRAAGQFECSTMLTKDAYTYSNKKLNVVYNYGVSSHANHFAPVTYNNELYITNKKACRKAYSHKSKVVWASRASSTSNTGVQYIVSEGINLEHENEDTGRAWYNKSLISQDRLVYDVEATDDRWFLNHKMVDGIPVFSYFDKKDENNGKIKDIYVGFNITSTTSTNPKYAILSKSPITTQVYSTNVESNPDYLVITNLNGTANNTKKVKLVEGENKLKISGTMTSKELLFLKLLWDDTNEESMTMTKPQITYTDVK